MRSVWSAATAADAFTLPHKVFELGLKHGLLLVYLCLIYRKSLKHGTDEMSCAIISKAVGLCEKTVRTHLRADFEGTREKISRGVVAGGSPAQVNSVAAPVPRCEAVCCPPVGAMATVHLPSRKTQRWPPCGPLWEGGVCRGRTVEKCTTL